MHRACSAQALDKQFWAPQQPRGPFEWPLGRTCDHGTGPGVGILKCGLSCVLNCFSHNMTNLWNTYGKYDLASVRHYPCNVHMNFMYSFDCISLLIICPSWTPTCMTSIIWGLSSWSCACTVSKMSFRGDKLATVPGLHLGRHAISIHIRIWFKHTTHH